MGAKKDETVWDRIHPDERHSAAGPLGCFTCANHRRVKMYGGRVDGRGRYHAPRKAKP